MYRLLEGRLRPGDQTDLFFLLGCLSDLMAVAASGLGYPQAAQELIRAGWAYATAIGHRPLMAQLRLQFASIVFWETGRTRRVTSPLTDCVTFRTAPPPRICTSSTPAR